MSRNRPEERLQRALVAYLRAALPRPWIVFHPANGGARTKAEAGVFKALGVLAGVPDLFVVGPWAKGLENDPRIIAIELKAPPKPLKRGGVSKAKPRTSEAQDAVIADLVACGVPTLIINNMDEAIRVLSHLGVPLKAGVKL